MTLNGDIFFYNYKGYQISEIVDRTSINLNFDATVRGAELEATYEPLPGLRFKFAGGYEDTRIKNGQQAVDLMDRTAGQPGWVLMKPFVTTSSNCVFPEYVVATLFVANFLGGEGLPTRLSLLAELRMACWKSLRSYCSTRLPYVSNPTQAENGALWLCGLPRLRPVGWHSFRPLCRSEHV